MKTEEGNKLIAEFMGWRKSGIHGWLPPNKEDSWAYGKDSILKYHFSWDWLMPVVEKIGKHKYHDGETAYPRTFGMLSPEQKYMVRFNRNQLFEGETLIEATYDACVDFIKWDKEKANFK